MIKFSARGAAGEIIVGLGLEAGNLAKLQAGQPVRVRLSDLGYVGAVGAVQVVIFYGETKEKISEMLAPLITPETVMHWPDPPIEVIEVRPTPTPRQGQCPVRPPLDGSRGNPMVWCQFAAKHEGRHSWEPTA